MPSFLELLANGGIVVAILLIFSVAALTISFYKVWHYWGFLRLSSRLPAEALKQLGTRQRTQALMLVKSGRNPRCELIRTVLTLFHDTSLSAEQIKDEAIRQARRLAASLQSFLRPLEVIAMLAPLLGLFGTVLGMIEAFRAMEAAGSQVNPALLSGGIWQALLTTAVGLAVAIPVSLIHSALERRAEVETLTLQDDLEQLFTLHALLEQEQVHHDNRKHSA